MTKYELPSAMDLDQTRLGRAWLHDVLDQSQVNRGPRGSALLGEVQRKLASIEQRSGRRIRGSLRPQDHVTPSSALDVEEEVTAAREPGMTSTASRPIKPPTARLSMHAGPISA